MSAFDDLFSNDAFIDNFGIEITYTRGVDTYEIQDVLESAVTNDQLLEYGASLITEGREFQVHKDAFADIGTPARGDSITIGESPAYEVSNIGGAPFLEDDADRNYWRIRTVRIAED